ncbi:MAG: HIT domain-containing protein [Gammaproteobacteria bacterium]
MEDNFKLHAQLEADTLLVASLSLNEVLLVNDKRYLWCILVPRIANLRDLQDIPSKYKRAMLGEMDHVSTVVRRVASAYKMNVAALGNMVEQLHVHVIARHRDDAAWPGPVWGVGNAEPYTNEVAGKVISDLRAGLSQAADKLAKHE